MSEQTQPGLVSPQDDDDVLDALRARVVALEATLAELKQGATSGTRGRLHDRLRFETLLLEIATGFINVPLDHIDAEIVRALGAVGSFAGADEGYVSQFNADGMTRDDTHYWLANGLPHVATLRGIPMTLYPWAIALIRAGETVHVPSVASIGPEAAGDRETWLSFGYHSLAAMPLAIDGEIIGYLGFASSGAERPWSEEELTLLRVLAEIVANALRRRRMDAHLHTLAARLQGLRTIGRGILDARSARQIADVVLDHLPRLVQIDHALVVAFDVDAGRAELLARRNPEVPADPTPGGEERPLPFLSCLVPTRVDDTHARPDDPDSAVLAALGVRSFLAIPLRVGETAVGRFDIGRSRVRPFTQAEIEIAVEVGEMLAVALNETDLQQRLARHAEELERTVEDRTAALRDKVAELESFTYSISHDLRAPLRAMLGLTQALVEDYGDRLDTAGHDFARRVMTSARRLDTLVQDLLTYSRLSAAELVLEEVRLGGALSQAISKLDREIARTGACIEIERPLPAVMAHPATLTIVLENLLSNALRYVAPGRPPVVRIRAETGKGAARVWIEDDGIGIEAAYHHRIFRLFERLHGGDTYPGTGVGLAIVHKAVTRMRGFVGVASEPGKGSRFWFELGAPLG